MMRLLALGVKALGDAHDGLDVAEDVDNGDDGGDGGDAVDGGDWKSRDWMAVLKRASMACVLPLSRSPALVRVSATLGLRMGGRGGREGRCGVRSLEQRS